METTPNGWQVLDRNAGVLSYTYNFSKVGRANTYAARIANGKMMVISPACRMPEEAFKDLTTFGDVGAVVVSNGFHHLGLAQWRSRFPQARFFAAPEAVKRIEKKNPAAVGTFEPMKNLVDMLGSETGVREVPLTKCGETWAWTKIGGGYAWFVSDVLANIEVLPRNPIFKALFKFTKSGPGYRVFHFALKFIVKDKRAVLKRMLDDMKEHPPTLIVPAHGTVLSRKDLAKETADLIGAAL